jgi:hypothetical protein
VIQGDLNRIDCDALLFPTDIDLKHSGSFATIAPARFEVPAEWGESVLSFSAGRVPENGPEVWLTLIGRSDPSEDDLATAVAAFLDGATAALDKRHLRLALPVVGTGFGGLRHDKGSAVAWLLPVLLGHVERHAVDVVLVTRNRRHYAAAQRERHRLFEAGTSPAPAWDLGDAEHRLRPLAEDLAMHLRAGQLVPFIGAGVSQPAGLPSWQSLLDEIYRRAGGHEDEIEEFHQLDLRDQATLLDRLHQGQGHYRQEVRKLIEKDRYALSHGLVASFRTRENVTTNYDTLFELACAEDRSSLAVLPYEPAGKDPEARWLLKLHGTLEQPDDLVLTRDDYLGLPSRAGALYGLLQAMLLTRHMLFLGYSLSDESFHKVLHEVRAARRGGRRDHPEEEFGTALFLKPQPLLETLLGDDLRVVSVADEGECHDTAARRFEILLDLIAFNAADLSSFLLDRTFESMLDTGERRLADQLHRLHRSLGAGPIEDRVRSLLESLGARD